MVGVCRTKYIPEDHGPLQLQTNHQREPEEDSIQLTPKLTKINNPQSKEPVFRIENTEIFIPT